MSVQFGRWIFDGCPCKPEYLERVCSFIACQASSACGLYTDQGVVLACAGFPSTRESRAEKQPHLLPSGAAITWDGRLDNRQELITLLGRCVARDDPDVVIAGFAYERWGHESFLKLLGDWAISIWNPKEKSLTLAKDFAGVRPLLYALDQAGVVWGSVLEPLVLFAGHSWELDKEYLAGWFAGFPAPHLTPYVGIRAVPPGSFVRIADGQQVVQPYWRFNPAKQLRYENESTYEEHFRSVFSESVHRRLRSDLPVLAELSGGMDSSSIVCVADRLISQGRAETPRLDTVSYFCDREPNWDERPYVAKVEELRGRKGFHISVGPENALPAEYPGTFFAPVPGARGIRPASMELPGIDASPGHRVLLSGIGGDELLGGVPNPLPELSDLFVKGQWRAFGARLVTWALAEKKPALHLLAETFGLFLPGMLRTARQASLPPWLQREFIERYPAVFRKVARFNLFGALPSFEENLLTFETLRSQIAQLSVTAGAGCEICFPFLDRDLVEFSFAVPREQLLRPGQRRSLMRRALTGIVPEEVLRRKRKAFVSRAPMVAFRSERERLRRISQDMVSARIGIIHGERFREALEAASGGQDVALVPILRALAIEYWLRHLSEWNLSRGPSFLLSDPMTLCNSSTAGGLLAEM